MVFSLALTSRSGASSSSPNKKQNDSSILNFQFLIYILLLLLLLLFGSCCYLRGMCWKIELISHVYTISCSVSITTFADLYRFIEWVLNKWLSPTVYIFRIADKSVRWQDLWYSYADPFFYCCYYAYITFTPLYEF